MRKKTFEIHELLDQQSYFEFLWQLEDSVLTDAIYIFCNIDDPEIRNIRVWHNGTFWDYAVTYTQKKAKPVMHEDCPTCGEVKHKNKTCNVCDYFSKINNQNS